MNQLAPMPEIAIERVGVRIEDVDLSYGTNHVLKRHQSRDRARRVLRLPRPVRLREDDAAAPHRRLQRGRSRARSGRRPRHLAPAAVEARRRHGVPVLCPVAAYDGPAQRRLRARGTAAAARRDRAAGGGSARPRRPRGISPTGGRRSSPAASSSASRSPARSRSEPKVLLLDEPLSNLDAKLRVQVRRELRDLQQRLGLTTIFVTHDQEEANTICDRIAVMNDGVVQQVGTPMELYERPANLFVASFLGTANILEGEIAAAGGERAFRIAEGVAVPIPHGVDVAPGSKLVFRPQDARIASGRGRRPARRRRASRVPWLGRALWRAHRRRRDRCRRAVPRRRPALRDRRSRLRRPRARRHPVAHRMSFTLWRASRHGPGRSRSARSVSARP